MMTDTDSNAYPDKDRTGMTLLDYFAGQIIVQILAATPKFKDWNKHDDKNAAENAYRLAAAMITEKRRLEGGE